MATPGYTAAARWHEHATDDEPDPYTPEDAAADAAERAYDDYRGK